LTLGHPNVKVRKEVVQGYECGLNIQNYNDIKIGDIVEPFEEIEVKVTL
jgi:translation initiation factor IF-2